MTDKGGLFIAADGNPVPGANKFNGDLSAWNVSRVTDMESMFAWASSFNSDISSWDVASVTSMKRMFSQVVLFNADVSTWHVSSVIDMSDMFSWATTFSRDISKWDVSRVTTMDGMFFRAASFNRKLCGAAWVKSKASKNNMFTGSSGSISRTVCTPTTTFSSKVELQGAVDECLEKSPKYGCFNGPHGPIAEWDVSSVTDMSRVFANANSFNGDISKWDVSSVTSMSRMFMRATSFNGDVSKWDLSSVGDMAGMFRQAKSFNRDLSKWDVSSVTDMDYMFLNAVSFNQNICGADWLRSKVSKKDMFAGSSGSISQAACTAAPAPVPNQTPRQSVSRRPMPDRELIVRTSSSTSVSAASITPKFDRTLTCPRCGTFRKSGRVSCCAPGGAWFKNCGGSGRKNVDHTWSQGVKACKRKFEYNNM